MPDSSVSHVRLDVAFVRPSTHRNGLAGTSQLTPTALTGADVFRDAGGTAAQSSLARVSGVSSLDPVGGFCLASQGRSSTKDVGWGRGSSRSLARLRASSGAR